MKVYPRSKDSKEEGSLIWLDLHPRGDAILIH